MKLVTLFAQGLMLATGFFAALTPIAAAEEVCRPTAGLYPTENGCRETASGLTWSPILSAAANEAAAEAACGDYRVDAAETWRLPSAAELQVFVTRQPRSFFAGNFDDVFWSSSSAKGSPGRLVSVVHGISGEAVNARPDISASVLCVSDRFGDSQLSAGGEHACSLDQSGVKCWGDDHYWQLDPPPLDRPIQVSAGGWHTCALDRTGVKCWGRDDFGQATVPPLKHPVRVSAGPLHTCALDQDGVVCWGNLGTYGIPARPVFDHPVQLSLGSIYVCALDRQGVTCLGDKLKDNIDGAKAEPGGLPFDRPQQVSAGNDHACILDANGVRCWGRDVEGQSRVPPLDRPTEVTAGGTHTCALDKNGVKCWGSDYFGQSSVPPLNKPVQVSAGFNFTCALDQDGVKCWGWVKGPDWRGECYDDQCTRYCVTVRKSLFSMMEFNTLTDYQTKNAEGQLEVVGGIPAHPENGSAPIRAFVAPGAIIGAKCKR